MSPGQLEAAQVLLAFITTGRLSGFAQSKELSVAQLCMVGAQSLMD